MPTLPLNNTHKQSNYFQDDDLDDEDKSLLADESSQIEDESLLSTSSHSTKAELTTESAPEKKIVVLKRTIAAPAADTIATAPTASEPSPKVAKLTELTATERLELRMKKFGGVSAAATAASGIPVNTDLKRQARAERFGIKTTTTATPTTAEKSDSENKPANNKIDTSTLETVSVEVLKKRAERFGTVSSNKLVSAENAERLAKRQDRFGAAAAVTTTTAPSNGSSDTTAADERAKKRLERFKTEVK